jgi:hypothetical protein
VTPVETGRYERTEYNADGSVTTTIWHDTATKFESFIYYSNGVAQSTDYDPTNSQPWDTHTIATDATNHVTADIYDYAPTVATFLNGSHSPDLLQVAKLTEASAAQLTVQLEREYFDGGVVGDHTPTPSVYNADVFGTGYSAFTSGSYDIDFGLVDLDPITPGTDVTLIDIGGTSGLDLSSTDNDYAGRTYDDPTDNIPPTHNFDGLTNVGERKTLAQWGVTSESLVRNEFPVCCRN